MLRWLHPIGLPLDDARCNRLAILIDTPRNLPQPIRDDPPFFVVPYFLEPHPQVRCIVLFVAIADARKHSFNTSTLGAAPAKPSLLVLAEMIYDN